MPLKGAKKRSYNKKYYADNKERISEKKKEAYQEDLEKSRVDSVSRTRTSYDKDPESGSKSTARSKATVQFAVRPLMIKILRAVQSQLLDQRPRTIEI